MSSLAKEFATSLLWRIASQRPQDFSGLGVVFYEHLEELPYIALETLGPDQIRLPLEGLESIASALASASSLASGCHDGFHFIDISKKRLTHLAQFLSPPLPHSENPAPRALGARHMTALLATRAAGIAGIGLLTNGNELAFFESGVQTLRETIV